MNFILLALLSISAQEKAGTALAPLLNPLKPLYMSYATTTTDHFYTMNIDDYHYSETIGFVGNGITAYLENNPTRDLDNLANPQLTKPFWRFYNAQYTDHFYTADENEAALVLGWGWVYEGIEGYIYAFEVPGSVPLHRLNKTNQVTHDHDHFYTTNDAEMAQMIRNGWAYDVVAGYVYTSSYPRVQGGLAMGFRTNAPQNVEHCTLNPVRGCLTRSQVFGDIFTRNTGYSPGKTVQWVSFDITSYGLASSGDHIGIMLRNDLDTQAPTKDGFYYWGMGLAMGELLGGIGSAEAVPENFRTGLAGTGSSIVWNDGDTYHVYVSVDQYHRVKYQLYLRGRLVASATKWMDIAYWHPESTGLFITGVGAGNGDWTAYIENLSYGWK